MQKGWRQTWRDVLFEHFELENICFLESLLPKGCTLDSFDEKYYLGLISMKMTNVRHKMFPNFIWFQSYNELNVRTYIRHNDKPGVLFLSLDVDSLISMLGARVLYGLPYRYRAFRLDSQRVRSLNTKVEEFCCIYEPFGEAAIHKEVLFCSSLDVSTSELVRL